MKFIFDENLPPDYAEGLSKFGKDVEHITNYFDQGAKDEEILRFIGKNGYFLVTKDRRIRYNPHEIKTLRQYKVGAFFMVGKTMTIWDIVKQIINCWDSIEEIAESQKTPFIYKLRRSGKPERYPL